MANSGFLDGNGLTQLLTNMKPPTVTVSPTSITGKHDPGDTVTVTISGMSTTNAPHVSIDNASVATATVSGNTITVTLLSTGTATLTLTVTGGPEFVTPATVEIPIDVSMVKIVSWSSGTDAEIVAMVEAADRGELDLYNDGGWRVGDERQVSLGAIASSGTANGVSWSVGESQSAQTVTMVLMHKGGYNLTSATSGGRQQCSFVVGLKNSLTTYGYMNSTNTNNGSWNSCARRNWCNGGFWNAVPSTLRSIFKQFSCITGTYNGAAAGGSNQTTNDYFALAAGKEVFGGGSSVSYSTDNEANALTQFTWYETTSNRIKKQGDTGSAYFWWERSPYCNSSNSFCFVYNYGTANYGNASIAYGLAPFGCI